MTVLVTGAAGFIGFHTARRLLADGETVVGIDNFNAYYDTELKESRWSILAESDRFQGERLNIADRAELEAFFNNIKPTRVVHLAAQAGVRHGVDHPHEYADANLVGMLNVLEGCRQCQVEHLVYASTSSVYGANQAMPFSEHHGAAHPVSLYAATKRANEAMAHAYAHLYGFPATGLRFFTVYGPWGRPDMALFMFTKAILAGEPIPVFNDGKLARDFTFIDDIVEGLVRVLATPATKNEAWAYSQADPASSGVAPHRLFNIGCGNPVKLMDFIAMMEDALGKKAIIDFQPMQPGDVKASFADIDAIRRDLGFEPTTPIDVGIPKFVTWFKEYEKI